MSLIKPNKFLFVCMCVYNLSLLTYNWGKSTITELHEKIGPHQRRHRASATRKQADTHNPSLADRGAIEQKLRLAVILRSTCWEAPSNLLSITLTAVTLGGVLPKYGCRKIAWSTSGKQTRSDLCNPGYSLTVWQSLTDVKALKC